MREKLFVLLAVVILLPIALTGCNSNEIKASSPKSGAAAASDPATSTDNIRRITTEEAKTALDAGSAVMIDVRSEGAFKAGHIKGAKLIGYSDIGARTGELPKDKTIILYCSCPAEHSSLAAAQVLKTKGIENTAALVGGYPKWQTAGYPTEKAE